MAFNAKQLHLSESVPNGATGAGRAGMTNFYRYVTADAQATVIGAGYFDAARAKLQKGDVIELLTDTGLATPLDKVVVVTAAPAAPGNVTVA